MTSITIPNSVTSIQSYAFYGNDILEVISKIENPFDIGYQTFSINTFSNASLYVPIGAIDKYKAKEGWKKFVFIEEGNGDEDLPMIGDANRDNIVNATDIVEVVNKIMGKPSKKFNQIAADVNNDGSVNDTDILKIVQIIMEQK